MKKLYITLTIALCTLILSSCANPASPALTDAPQTTASSAGSSSVLLATSTLSGQNTSLPADALNKKPIDFELKDINGNSVSSSSFAGKPTIINFFATWCKYCKNEMPYFSRLESEYGDKINVVYIDTLETVSTSEVKTFFKDLNMSYTNLLIDSDSSLIYSYAYSSIPVTIIIDSDGIIRKIQLGAFTSYKTLENYLVNYGQLK